MLTAARRGTLGHRRPWSGDAHKTALMLVLALLVGSLLGLRRAGPLGDPVASASRASQIGAGHSVSDLRLVLDPASPSLVGSVRVQFASLSASVPASVQVRAGAGGAWGSCERGPGSTTWICPTPGLTARDAAQLMIIAR
jgi:hypothetical protein